MYLSESNKVASSPSELQLSREERRAIRLAWDADFGKMYELGSNIYVELFARDPRRKVAFPQLAKYDLSKKEWLDDPQFQKQVLRFMQTLSTVVECLDFTLNRQGDMDERLFQLGKRHQKYYERGLQIKHFDGVDEIIQDVMKQELCSCPKFTEEKERLEAIRGWEKLSIHIIAKIREGAMTK